MDFVGSIRFYVDRMFENVQGMKSLILDRETVSAPWRETPAVRVDRVEPRAIVAASG